MTSDRFANASSSPSGGLLSEGIANWRFFKLVTQQMRRCVVGVLPRVESVAICQPLKPKRKQASNGSLCSEPVVFRPLSSSLGDTVAVMFLRLDVPRQPSDRGSVVSNSSSSL
eukprot:87360-Rhodomonas_salina.1